ncbi:MAG: hypothetical protein MJ233_03730 [Mycoplasmoidaceae bacterium]|nr:hypothetical protein [Mycoplasmoidaceae bacterium]
MSGPDDVTARIDQIDGTKVKVLFELADPSTSSYAERAFTIKFKFIYDNVQQGELIPIYNFKIVPKEPYVAPHIKLTGTATESLTLQTIEGTTGVYINSQENATKTPTADRYFYLEDDSGNPVELGADDEIKVIDNKANVNTTCFVNTVPDTASEKSIYIDLMCSFNDVYDPYVTDKSETFNVTFQFYHLGELVSEQTINTDITLKYTPLPSVAVESKQFGIVFEPVEIDQDGDFNIDFVGRIGKKDSQS